MELKLLKEKWKSRNNSKVIIMKNIIIRNLNEKEAELIEKLLKKTGQIAGSKALIRAADIVVNQLPFIEARRDENYRNFLLYKEKYQSLLNLVKQLINADEKLKELKESVMDNKF